MSTQAERGRSLFSTRSRLSSCLELPFSISLPWMLSTSLMNKEVVFLSKLNGTSITARESPVQTPKKTFLCTATVL